MAYPKQPVGGGGAGTDTTAIHDDTAGEVAAITEKASPTGSDIVVIEDAADSNNKKRVTLGNLPAGGVDINGLSAISGHPEQNLDHVIVYDDSGAANVKMPLESMHAAQVDARCRKGSAGTISMGAPVYISGWNAGLGIIEVEEADADNAAAMPCLGLAEGDLTNAADGYTVLQGNLAGFDTSSFSVGDELWVSTTAGTLTATKPTGSGDAIQKVAIVLRSHASLGVVTVFGAGRSNDVPNLADGAQWVGQAAGNTTTIKHNFGASVAPDGDNDVDEGYSVGSQWYDTTAGASYVCLSATDGAADWNQIDAAGGGSGLPAAWYSSGDDGAISQTSNTSLTGDLYPTTYTVSNNSDVDTDGYGIWASVSITVDSGSKIQWNGIAASGATAGAAGALRHVDGGEAGGNGGASGNGSPGSSTNPSAVVNAGGSTADHGAEGGDSGQGQSGGNGGSAIGADSRGHDARMYTTVWDKQFFDGAGATKTMQGGAGGGGGASDDGSGGGGGGGAGIIILFAPTITVNGTLEVVGGAGAAPPSGTNSGGGGGGGGGAIILVYNTLTLGTSQAVNLLIDGGAGGGSPTGTGSAGGAGQDGVRLLFDMGA